MTKTRVELSLIRPGVLSDNGENGTIKCTEDRLKLLDIVAVVKIKGKLVKETQSVIIKVFRGSHADFEAESAQ